MPLLSQEEITALSRLIKIRISETEKARIQKELSSILSFVGAIGRVVGKRSPAALPAEKLVNIFRLDEPRVWEKDTGAELIAHAPRRRGDLIVSPGIFKDRGNSTK